MAVKYAYRLGRALMLPVACLASGRTFNGNRVLDGSGWSRGQLSAFTGSGGCRNKSLIDNMSLLFTLGVAVGMADEQDGTAALAGVASWLVVQQILTADNVRDV